MGGNHSALFLCPLVTVSWVGLIIIESMRTKEVSSYPITLQEAKQYVKVENDLEDAYIETCISGSVDYITSETNCDFVPTTYTFKPFPNTSGDVYLTMQDVDNVSTGSLKYCGGVYYTYFDQPYSGEISYTVAPSGSYPAAVKVASLMLVSHWFENRGVQVIGTVAAPLAFSVGALLASYKHVNSA